MFWLQPTPWARWIAAVAIAGVALWFEVAGGGSQPHPFALVDIGRGEPITATNTELRSIPAGLLQPPGPGTVAAREIAAGEPILSGDSTTPGHLVPAGWWTVAADVPPGAMRGDPVRLVLRDGGVFEGVVADTGDDDPFGTVRGTVAVPPEAAESVARAAAAGTLIVLIGTG